MGASDSRPNRCPDVRARQAGETRDMTWMDLKCEALKDAGEHLICTGKEPREHTAELGTTLEAGELAEFSRLRDLVLRTARAMLGSTHTAAATCTMSLKQYAGFAATKLGVDYSDLIAQKLADLQSDGFRESLKKWKGKRGKATITPKKYLNVLKEMLTQHEEIHRCYDQYISLYPGKAGVRERKPINEAYYPQMKEIMKRAEQIHTRGRVKLALKHTYESGEDATLLSLDWKSSPLPRSEHLFQQQRARIQALVSDLESEMSKQFNNSAKTMAWTIVHLLSFNLIQLGLRFVYDLAKLPPLDDQQKDILLCIVSVYLDALWKRATGA